MFNTQLVEYLMHMGNDNTVANTARVSMGCKDDWLEVPAGYSENRRNSLITYLAEHKHTSPFRHNAISIRCKVPVFIARQLGKHQVGMSWNEVSRRYVDANIEFFEMQDTWRQRPDKSIKQGSAGLFDEATQSILNDQYENVLDLALGTYEAWIKEGVAPEQARAILPQSMMVDYIWTGSLMAFAHVYTLRIDGHAQQEAREFAKQLDTIIRPLFPISWEALVG
ncbi:putative thymidylate synthase [Alteromonas phage vB_AmeP_R8W]|uniref:Putative thymidylate synthase n=1 Tax=Alteromonas phage vB_AmeP_R8W TaxID=2774152 RepID=A0A8E4RFX9_9CAUD|nr:putative thymidylate synthase [Alteromonas phage vB_AmeP_R8W]